MTEHSSTDSTPYNRWRLWICEPRPSAIPRAAINAALTCGESGGSSVSSSGLYSPIAGKRSSTAAASASRNARSSIPTPPRSRSVGPPTFRNSPMTRCSMWMRSWLFQRRMPSACASAVRDEELRRSKNPDGSSSSVPRGGPRSTNSVSSGSLTSASTARRKSLFVRYSASTRSSRASVTISNRPCNVVTRLGSSRPLTAASHSVAGRASPPTGPSSFARDAPRCDAYSPCDWSSVCTMSQEVTVERVPNLLTTPSTDGEFTISTTL